MKILKASSLPNDPFCLFFINNFNLHGTYSSCKLKKKTQNKSEKDRKSYFIHKINTFFFLYNLRKRTSYGLDFKALRSFKTMR